MSTEGWDIVEQAAELARRGEEFALATVVWRQAPSSGQTGARAIITVDGPALRLHRRRLRRAGRAPRGRARDREPRAPAAVPRHRPTCPRPACPRGCSTSRCRARARAPCRSTSNPSSPPSTWCVVGGSPMTHTLAELAGALGWKTRVIEAARALAPPTSPSAPSWSSPPRATATRRPSGSPSPRPRRSSAWSPRASAGRRCWPTSPSVASPSTSSTGSVRRSGSTSAAPATRRSRSPCSPSSCSAARPASCPPHRPRPPAGEAGGRRGRSTPCAA